MRLPSIRQAAQDCRQTFQRFPLVLCLAALGTVCALIIVDREGPLGPSVLYKILLSAGLGIPLLTAFALTAEKRKWSQVSGLAFQGLGLLLLVGYALTVPSDLTQAPQIYLNRFGLFMATVLTLVIVAPYLAKGELNGFWQYNKTLFYRLLTSALFTAVLFVGLAIALAALDNLFGVNVPARRYAELWIALVGLFGIWFFLAGLPADLKALDSSSEYPKGLRIFAQYILLPLVLVYLVILYAYIGKIVAQWNWPKGWVSGLILGFTATGIFSLLLLYPIRELAENAWIRRVWRWFFPVCLPLVVVLFLAASQRISQYGITEGRYLLLTCGGWLAVVSLYFSLNRKGSIKFIPISIGLISFFVAFGPWGLFAVSENSQIARLTTLLTRNEILVNTKVQKAPSTVPPEDANQISAVLDYLRERHGYESIQPWFSETLRADSAGAGSRYKTSEAVAGLLGVEYTRFWNTRDIGWFTASLDGSHAITVDGYDRILLNQMIDSATEPHNFPDENFSYHTSKTLDTFTFVVLDNGQAVDSLRVNLLQFVQNLLKSRSGGRQIKLPPDSLAVSAEKEGLKIRIVFDNFTGSLKESKVESITGTASILYSINRLRR